MVDWDLVRLPALDGVMKFLESFIRCLPTDVIRSGSCVLQHDNDIEIFRMNSGGKVLDCCSCGVVGFSM